MKLTKILALAAAGVVASATLASAHVWNIGWKSTDGNLTFYGVSWHGGTIGGTGTVDDFTDFNAGFVVNGHNLAFDIGSATDMNDCFGAGGLTSGTCAPTWDALNLDGALHSDLDPSDTYGKYATRTILAADLASIGIVTGNNSITFTTYADNATWAARPFSSADIPVDINVTPPTVPLPAGLPLALAGFGLLGGLRLRKRAK